MVKIRLTRTGRKNLATYRIVVTNAREKRDSRSIENLGVYLPHQKQIEINEERVKYWLSVGAQPTETVKNLLIKKEIIKAPANKRTYSKSPKRKSQERAEKKAQAKAE